MGWDTSLPRSPNAISLSCQTYDVRPIAPDPVEDLTVTFMQAFPQSDTPSPSGSFERLFITLRYTWTAPEFEGEGITGYQARLERAPAPEKPTGSLQQIGLMTNSDVLRKLFEESDANFTLYFQVSWCCMYYSIGVVELPTTRCHGALKVARPCRQSSLTCTTSAISSNTTSINNTHIIFFLSLSLPLRFVL